MVEANASPKLRLAPLPPRPAELLWPPKPKRSRVDPRPMFDDVVRAQLNELPDGSPSSSSAASAAVASAAYVAPQA